MSKKQYNYTGKVVKQGNSLCVRIPNLAKKELQLKEGSDIIVTLERMQRKYNQEEIEYLLKLANSIKKLDKYGEEKKRFFVTLNFRFVEKTLHNEELQIEFIKKLKKEFGDKLIDEWLKFEQELEEAFQTDKQGLSTLKKKYQKIMDKHYS